MSTKIPSTPSNEDLMELHNALRQLESKKKRIERRISRIERNRSQRPTVTRTKNPTHSRDRSSSTNTTSSTTTTLPTSSSLITELHPTTTNQNNTFTSIQQHHNDPFEVGAVVTIAKSQRKRRIYLQSKHQYRNLTVNAGRIEKVTTDQLYLSNKLLRFRIDKSHCKIFLHKEQGNTYCAPFNPF